jgi:UPF0716 protein FxsA
MDRMPILLIAFIVVPIVELFVIGRISDLIGLPLTILLLVVDSLVGAVLVRHEGRRAWTAFRRALAEGRWPGDEVAQGALVLVGGALLLTPGFVTDVVGLAAVVPPTRALLSRAVRSRMTTVSGGVLGASRAGPRRPPPRRPGEPRPSGPDAVDVEVVSIEREQPTPPPADPPDRPSEGSSGGSGDRREP